MRLLSYKLHGEPGWGAAIDERTVVDLKTATAGRVPTLRAALESMTMTEIAALARSAGVQVSIDEIEYLPVIPDAARIICVGLNYDEHRIEANRDRTASPALFVRFASSQVGHAQPLVVPRESERLDYEGEIAIIIGRGGRRIAEGDAWEHVAGYAPYNDGSVRDWQAHTTQWTAGKNFSGTGGFGPWMVTRDEIADGEVLELVTRLNGRELQRGSTDQMIFPIPRLIAYVSTFMSLEPGDVIVTGTPGGVGFKRNPPIFMRVGDRVEVEVSRVGTLLNTVVAE